MLILQEKLLSLNPYSVNINNLLTHIFLIFLSNNFVFFVLDLSNVIFLDMTFWL